MNNVNSCQFNKGIKCLYIYYICQLAPETTGLMRLKRSCLDNTLPSDIHIGAVPFHCPLALHVLTMLPESME